MYCCITYLRSLQRGTQPVPVYPLRLRLDVAIYYQYCCALSHSMVVGYINKLLYFKPVTTEMSVYLKVQYLGM